MKRQSAGARIFAIVGSGVDENHVKKIYAARQRRLASCKEPAKVQY